MGDIEDGDIDGGGVEAEERREDGEEEPGVEAVEEDLEDAVEGDECGGVLGVALGEVVPDDDHSDASGEADEDEADHVVGVMVEEEECEGEHEDGADEPVLDEGEGEDFGIFEDIWEFFVTDFGQGGIHHEDEADGQGEVGGAEGEAVEEGFGFWEEVSEGDAQEHGEDDPEGEIAVEEV